MLTDRDKRNYRMLRRKGFTAHYAKWMISSPKYDFEIDTLAFDEWSDPMEIDGFTYRVKHNFDDFSSSDDLMGDVEITDSDRDNLYGMYVTVECVETGSWDSLGGICYDTRWLNPYRDVEFHIDEMVDGMLSSHAEFPSLAFWAIS